MSILPSVLAVKPHKLLATKWCGCLFSSGVEQRHCLGVRMMVQQWMAGQRAAHMYNTAAASHVSVGKPAGRCDLSACALRTGQSSLYNSSGSREICTPAVWGLKEGQD
jgi:hypothetical protein